MRTGGSVPEFRATHTSPADEVAPYSLADDSLGDDVARRLLTARRMDTTRALLEAHRRECVTLIDRWEDGMPDQRPLVLDQLALIEAALAEVEAAERGCSGEPGECLCPCHAGIRHP